MQKEQFIEQSFIEKFKIIILYKLFILRIAASNLCNIEINHKRSFPKRSKVLQAFQTKITLSKRSSVSIVTNYLQF